MMYYIAVFKTKNHAMNIFYALEEKRITPLELISTPAKIVGGCSFSIKFDDLSKLQYFKQVNNKLSDALYGVYSVEKLNGKKHYEQLEIII